MHSSLLDKFSNESLRAILTVENCPLKFVLGIYWFANDIDEPSEMFENLPRDQVL